MLKIAVLGSCVSRDPFNSKFVPDYKNYYSCVLHQNQTSMISLTSKSIPFDSKLIDNLSPFDTRHFRTELDKSFFSDMIKHQPDYLIMDFYGDLYYGVQRVGDSYITNKKWLFKRTSQYGVLDLQKEYTIFRNDQEWYLKEWKKGVDSLFKFLKKKVPNCKVIINKARFVDRYWDVESGRFMILSKSGKKKYINIKLYNKWWRTLDKYVIENHDVRVLRYDMSKYYAIEDHPWGIFYVHYNMKFYQDFTIQLQRIISRDMEEKEMNRFERAKRKIVRQVKYLKRSLNRHIR